MKLVDFMYRDASWQMKTPMHVEDIALLVGNNAMGKSRLIECLSKVIRFILQLSEPSSQTDFVMGLTWNDGGRIIEYFVDYTNGDVVNEMVWVNKQIVLERKTNNDTLLKGKVINPPSNKLVVGTQRDVKEYPEFEQIVRWAESVVLFSFNELEIYGDRKNVGLGLNLSLYDIVKSLSKEALENVANVAHSLHYNIEKVYTIAFGDFRRVLVREAGVSKPLTDVTMSKGMFRTLYMLIVMEYFWYKRESKTFIIDDMCEGLDYKRSTLLGKRIAEYAKDHELQLIISSNDSFLMDAIDLKYWNIVSRDGIEVSVMNPHNSPKLFEDFKYTGLSNFDFFSSDFIERQEQKENGKA